MNAKRAHTFHIPVMGIGYTIDTPLKVAQYGIDSCISLVDDILLEKLRKMFCEKHRLPYVAISDQSIDHRAERITAYLNLMKILSEQNFEQLKTAASLNKADRYDLMKMMPLDTQKAFNKFNSSGPETAEIKDWLDKNLLLGSIDVNIMTKVDKDNYNNGEKLPVEYNDAHAALRGFAKSELSASIVLSAGINLRLYTYMSEFEDFYPDSNGHIKKKIVLKVSDYKSALIQGKFLAKKGLWVSEYRIESGLNCGGHAFATDGFLMGPILAEFRDKRKELVTAVYDTLVASQNQGDEFLPMHTLPLKITAQGGVGTAEEHQFLIDHYKVDSVGWGTPFLLVPEATTVDDETLEKLKVAKEDDLYLSDISPLGIPFNSLRGNTKDLEKLAQIAKGHPGSSCSKKYAALSNEFSDKTICTASRRYQTLKLKELSKAGMSDKQYDEAYAKIVDKACICVGLGTSYLIAHKLDTRIEGNGVSICPGPNMAYFSRAMSLKEITDHIYGKGNVISRKDRPHMFIKELLIYIDFLEKKIKKSDPADAREKRNHIAFADHLVNGVDYYISLFSEFSSEFGIAAARNIEILKDKRIFILTMVEESELIPVEAY